MTTGRLDYICNLSQQCPRQDTCIHPFSLKATGMGPRINEWNISPVIMLCNHGYFLNHISKWQNMTILFIVVFIFLLQGPGVCRGEAVWELAEGCPRLGHFQEPLLGHAYPSVGQR